MICPLRPPPLPFIKNIPELRVKMGACIGWKAYLQEYLSNQEEDPKQAATAQDKTQMVRMQALTTIGGWDRSRDRRRNLRLNGVSVQKTKKEKIVQAWGKAFLLWYQKGLAVEQAVVGIQGWVKRALDFGFSGAAALDAATLALRPEVRDMCSADKCRLYGRSWMCPPGCGSLEENAVRLQGYTVGLLVQTVGQLEDDFDYEGMQEAGALQKQRFALFARELKQAYPGLLALSSGGCELCGKCTYPDAPCRHPEQAMPSMEAFGLVVSDVCRANELPYYYGPGTIAYTGCYLLK